MEFGKFVKLKCKIEKIEKMQNVENENYKLANIT